MEEPFGLGLLVTWLLPLKATTTAPLLRAALLVSVSKSNSVLVPAIDSAWAAMITWNGISRFTVSPTFRI